VKLGWPGIPLWLGWCLFWPPNASFWEKLFDADIGFTTSKWLINRIIYWDLPTMINQPFKEVFINGEIKWWINHLPTIYRCVTNGVYWCLLGFTPWRGVIAVAPGTVRSPRRSPAATVLPALPVLPAALTPTRDHLICFTKKYAISIHRYGDTET
jgi:hypothetical protein